MWPAAAGWRAITCRGCARRARRSAAKPCGATRGTKTGGGGFFAAAAAADAGRSAARTGGLKTGSGGLAGTLARRGARRLSERRRSAHRNQRRGVAIGCVGEGALQPDARSDDQ